MTEAEDRLQRLQEEVERRLVERFAALRDEFDRLRLESDRRWEGFLSRFDQDFRGIVPPELVAVPEAEQARDAGSRDAAGLPDRPAGAGLLSIEIARNLDDAGNQVEALHRFLELCRRHASRSALLIAKAGGLAVWKATGFSDHGGNDEAARRITFPMDSGPLARVLEGAAFRLDADNEVSRQLGATSVAGAVLVPMVVKEKVSGAVYADCTVDEASRFDPESIAFLTFLAGLFVDRLAGRKLKPAPALRSLQELGGGAEPARTLRAEPQPEPILEFAPPPDSPGDSYGTRISPAIEAPAPAETMRFSEPDFARPEPAPEPPPPTPISDSERQLDEAREPEPEPEPERTVEPEHSLAYEEEPATPARTQRLPETPAPAPPRAAAPPPPPPAPEPVYAPEPPAAASSARPSVGARRLAGPLAPAEGDERRDEARRFAKLLVSEIKLYNEKAVLEGRQHGNLYERLKEDIDRSRQMYDERIPEDVRSSSNFFYEELVRILAEGRAEALGI